jgi:transposase-like protein
MVLRHRRLPQSIGIVEVLGNHALRIEERSIQCNRVPHDLEAFAQRWWDAYPQLVTTLLWDLPELLVFSQCLKGLWRKLRTTNVIKRCFVEVRRRTRPMVWFVNLQSVERIIFSIFNRFNVEWRQHTLLRQFTQVA